MITHASYRCEISLGRAEQEKREEEEKKKSVNLSFSVNYLLLPVLSTQLPYFPKFG